MTDKSFSADARKTLLHYVYRLVDPRNGETFHVGRGQDDRVFQHVAGAIKNAGKDELDPKFSRINQIRAEGLEVQHIIHRHGMDLDTAKEVEAAPAQEPKTGHQILLRNRHRGYKYEL